MKSKIQISPNSEYKWNVNFRDRLAYVDIKKVVSELNTIFEIHGEVTPLLILESSKNKKSVLHNYFEWDNEKAANKWRIAQVGALLKNIEVKVIKDGNPYFVRAFEITKRGTEEGRPSVYKSFNALSDDNIEYLKNYAIGHLKSVITKLIIYDQFSDAIKLCNEAILLLSKESTETKGEISKGMKAVS